MPDRDYIGIPWGLHENSIGGIHIGIIFPGSLLRTSNVKHA